MSSRVVVALRVAASPERAFEAFTGQIGRWWRPNPLFRFTPRDPGVLSFEPGEGGRLVETLASGKVFEIGKIKVWSPPRRLVVGWRQATFAPGQDTEVEIRFEAVGEETRITVEHTGWDTVPAGHVARHGFPDVLFLRRQAEWWQDLLSSCKMAASRGEGTTDG
ncbi:MAG: SRPBCC family protein [Pseudomonadota bacterium]